MKKYKWIIILLNLLFLLLYVNYSIGKKEKLLKDGDFILLALAPVDPRSLMQGDYMILRYKISEEVPFSKLPKRGYCVIAVDSNHVARLIRFQKDPQPLNSNEQIISYGLSNNLTLHIGAESFFFQEGQSEKFANARYGGLKIDKKGNSLLIGLYDIKRNRIH